MQNRERNKVVLVDTSDRSIGEMDKLEAHVKGSLHRAFSIFIFNAEGHMLIHQRAAHKYHGAGLWTNACCSHPQWGEELLSSAQERLLAEMGMTCPIQKVYDFIYYVPVENNLIEHEYDHVFVGYSNANPNPNPEEVQDFKWISIPSLKADLQEHPHRYTYWFKQILPELLTYLDKNKI